jgi:hypothetical protein
LAEEVRANNAVNAAAGRGGIEKKAKATALSTLVKDCWSAARRPTVRLATTGTAGRIISSRRWGTCRPMQSTWGSSAS